MSEPAASVDGEPVPVQPSGRPGNVPAGYYSEDQIADFENKKVATLRSEAARRKGAPRTKIGRTILYRKESYHAYLLSHERDYEGRRARSDHRADVRSGPAPA